MDRIYEGPQDELADLALVLHSFLQKWLKRHQNYGYVLHLKEEELHLNIIKNNEDGRNKNKSTSV